MAGQGPARRRRASRLHPVRIAVLTLFCLMLSGTAGAAAYFFPVVVAGVGQTGQTVVVPPPSRNPGTTSTPTPSAAPGAPFTVLLLGSDDDGKNKNPLTQSMILVRVDPTSKHVTMLSIPRDLWVPLSTGERAKIDAAYAIGGAAAAIATVERNLHVHIDEYAWVGLKGLIKLIDRLGGVDLLVSNPGLHHAHPDRNAHA